MSRISPAHDPKRGRGSDPAFAEESPQVVPTAYNLTVEGHDGVRTAGFELR